MTYLISKTPLNPVECGGGMSALFCAGVLPQCTPGAVLCVHAVRGLLPLSNETVQSHLTYQLTSVFVMIQRLS